MPLLEDIQSEAVDSSSDLGTLLRKCKVLGANLDSKSLEDWLLYESNGYPSDAVLPDYRIWPLELKGHFAGPFGSGLRNAPIPSVCVPKNWRDKVSKLHYGQSIATIEQLLRENNGGMLHTNMGDLAVLLGTKVYDGMNCIQVWGEFGSSELVEVINAVRNRILDFVLAIRKEDPSAGESKFGYSTLQTGRVNQIFNTIVYGGNANLVGNSEQSTVHFGVQENNFETVSSYLKSIGVEQTDIDDLRDAIQGDDLPTRPEAYGSGVSAWIAKMIGKAASGAWQIGIAAAGALLAQALAKYYGLED